MAGRRDPTARGLGKNDSPPPVTKVAVETIKGLYQKHLFCSGKKIALPSVREIISIKSKAINITA